MLIIIGRREAKKHTIISDVESVFRLKCRAGERFSETIYMDIMRGIDSVKKREDYIIETKFGVTAIDNLSSGCKAVMLAVLLKNEDIYVSIDECGENALRVLFELSDRLDLKVMVTNYITIYDTDIECMIESRKYMGGYNIYRRLVEINE